MLVGCGSEWQRDGYQMRNKRDGNDGGGPVRLCTSHGEPVSLAFGATHSLPYSTGIGLLWHLVESCIRVKRKSQGVHRSNITTHHSFTLSHRKTDEGSKVMTT
jgi:hypothetical protein